MVELLLLILCSYHYAINKPHNSTQSAEPFFANQSGYKVLVEDVTPIPSVNGIVSDGMKQVVEYVNVVKSFIYELIGIEVEKVEYQYKPRRVSVFVKEMRDQVSNINIPDKEEEEEEEEDSENCKEEDSINVSPPLQLNLRLPLTGSTEVHIGLAQQLQKAFKERRAYINAPKVRVGVVDESKVSSRYHMERIDGDLFKLPTKSIKQHSGSREVRHPELLIIMGCVHTIPKDEKVTVELVEDIILVRVRVEHIRFLYDILEEIVDKVLANIFSSSISQSSSLGGYKINTVSINLIDEDPSSYISEKTGNIIDNYTAKSHFDTIGKALSSSVTSTISPILEDLSFIYGGQIKVTGGDGDDAPNLSISSKITIELDVHSSAYLPLPDKGWMYNDAEEDGQKLIWHDSMANWLNEHTSQPTNNDATLPDNVQWTMVVPSTYHAPLAIMSDGGESTEMMISPTTFDPSKSCGIYPNGLSIINPSSFREYLDDSNNKLRTETLQPNSILLDDVYQGYKNNTKRSLGYLVSAIRGIHGLPPSPCDDPDECCECESKIDCVPQFKSEPFSFWELESIARSHYSTTLETVLNELDSLHAVLYQHGSTLAFPEELAYKLNNATHLLRQSIELTGEGYPTIYTTSLLYGSLRHIESVQSDYQFHELPYFAIDHYLAVFSPLVLPLMLPMIAGLIREVKRFKEHKKKRTSFFASMNSF